MASTKLTFNVDEVERLQTKIRLVSQDTNRLYLQLRGQTNNWGGIPLGSDLIRAQTLINELTVEAEKLEDIIRGAIKGVQGAQDENKRQANQLFQQLGVLGGMFERFGGGSAIGQSSIPTTAQKAVTNLITSIATLLGWDELNSDPMVQKLQATVKKSGLGTIDSIAAQSKLKDIYLARDQIAKAQTAYEVYQAFGNQTQMDAMHELAEDARKKLKSLGIDEVRYQAGKDLSTYFKKPAVKACDYDPSITSRSIPLVQNETYQLLLRTAMEKGEKGAWAKGQLEGVQTTMEQMIATGVSLGVHVMTNQGGKAWGDVIKLTSSVAQLDSYNLFRKNKTEEQAKPEDSKNAFYKSIDSFKEIGTGFVGTLRTRADKATDSPYDFFNWLTLGITGDIPVGIYEAAKDRSEHMFDSKEKFADWLTLGTVEMAKGAFNPDEAWSADHWLNSLGMVTLLYGPVEKSLLPTGGGGLKPPKGLDSVKGIEVQKPLPAFSTNEGFQFKINNLDIDTPALPQTPMQINFKNEMDRILKEKMEGKSDSNHSIKDVEVKAVEGTGEGRLKPTKLSSEKIQLDWLPDKYTAVEVKGSVKVAGKDVDVSRRVYQIEIDKNYVPKDPAAGGLTNKELMSKGKSPYAVKDGVESKVELHHLIQKEPGGMVEIAESTHDKYSSQLHGLVEDGNSFRNDPLLEKQYNNFRSNYWKMRANED
ncbi:MULTISPECIES: HNH/ENDO VII family nuclease [Paenibacillus]|uniref:HNH/ENDO VII family nuclease n=1 Tax=Paenibacillus TaxID=44249 RepID=UPI002116CFC9|nr:HNH/ENDO VII family nuclease [Paenibacillus odorifer]